MNPLVFPLLADENISPAIVQKLLDAGKDIVSVNEEGLSGASDRAVLQAAHRSGRVVVTHASDLVSSLFETAGRSLGSFICALVTWWW